MAFLEATLSRNTGVLLVVMGVGVLGLVAVSPWLVEVAGQQELVGEVQQST